MGNELKSSTQSKANAATKSVVLLSGGLDSTVNLAAACRETQVQRVLSFDYGQRAALKEVEAAKAVAKHFGVPHEVIGLTWLSKFSGSSLTDVKKSIPRSSEVQIDDRSASQKSAQSVWVPNRNGVFLNIGALVAEGLGCQEVIPGFNAEEAATFPDNSAEFMKALDQSFSFSTANKVRVRCYTVGMTKTELVKWGRELGVPFDLCWPCYESGAQWCGQCESCQRARRALSANGIEGRFG